MLPLFAEVEWQSAIVAIVLLVLIAAIMIIAMFRYDLDGVLKLWGALGTLFGLVIGSMATYFFTNQTHEARTAQLRAENMSLTAQRELAVVTDARKRAEPPGDARKMEKKADERATDSMKKTSKGVESPSRPQPKPSAPDEKAQGPG
jgi:hypothetical protein